MNRPLPQLAGAAATTAPQPRGRATYLQVLGWVFAVVSAVRLVTYLPTIWAIHASGASDQHSLFTWLTWCLANVTMGLMVIEQTRSAGGKPSSAAFVSFGNALMCAATAVTILLHR